MSHCSSILSFLRWFCSNKSIVLIHCVMVDFRFSKYCFQNIFIYFVSERGASSDALMMGGANMRALQHKVQENIINRSLAICCKNIVRFHDDVSFKNPIKQQQLPRCHRYRRFVRIKLSSGQYLIDVPTYLFNFIYTLMYIHPSIHTLQPIKVHC
ncbi:unnamed protein product [Parnassius mnemosyne]|uniref:Uncharacterized protein n=1 Tax=Parnassius mnemosyne TaxID=213953 RepID=A0AAV1LKU9_9NEOP